MAFWKKRHHSELFDSDVWIVNVGIEQAQSDPEIAATDIPIFVSDELKEIKNCPEEDRDTVARLVFCVKKTFPGARLIRHGEYQPTPTVVY